MRRTATLAQNKKRLGYSACFIRRYPERLFGCGRPQSGCYHHPVAKPKSTWFVARENPDTVAGPELRLDTGILFGVNFVVNQRYPEILESDGEPFV
jgi:hypothetical protein